MSKELYLHPFKRDAAPQIKQLPVVAASAALLPSHELATRVSHLNRLKARVMSALSANFENFSTSYLSKAAHASMHGFVKDDVLYLPMIYA